MIYVIIYMQLYHYNQIKSNYIYFSTTFNIAYLCTYLQFKLIYITWMRSVDISINQSINQFISIYFNLHHSMQCLYIYIHNHILNTINSTILHLHMYIWTPVNITIAPQLPYCCLPKMPVCSVEQITVNKKGKMWK